MSFKRDNSKVKSFSTGAIKHTGMYLCTITKAFDRDSTSSEAKAIHFDLVSDTGQYASIDLWHTSGKGVQVDKNGRDLPAIQSINDLMVLLDLDDLQAKRGFVHLYDYELKQEVEVKKMIYSDLINQSIGCVFQMVESTKQANINGTWQDSPSGERICRPEFLVFCDAQTHASAAEFLATEENPVAIEKYIAGLEPIKNSQLALGNHMQNAPVKDPVKTNDAADWGGDIPF